MTDPTGGRSLDAALPELRAALAGDGGAAVLVAPPGTGKTTLVPLALLDEPWAAGGRIMVLEPRRLATRAAARRMASLLGDDVGGTVGYRTRDERMVGPRTRIEVVTEGILTRRLQQDPELPGVALVVFDEVHERNLQTDLGLALALDVRRTIRPDLRILAMSATIDADRVAGLLGGVVGEPGRPAAVIEAGVRPHPVDVRWFPKRPADRLEPAVVNVIETAMRRESGDALVFLPGAGEITRVADLLHRAGLADRGIDVRPLYGMLPAAEQDAALLPSPHDRRRVVLATDIAETSLTVEGVRIVVDSGLAREPRFDVRSGLTRLQTVQVAKSSAEQRAGRAGRTAPGVVYRLWSKGEHATRRAHRQPEIGQVDLAALALDLAAWGVADPATMAFLDQPPERTFADGRDLLALLGALDERGTITTLGREMSALPLHPRLARMVALAASTGPRDAALACAIAALLEDRDVLRGRPDDVPTDLVERLALLADPARRHPQVDGRAVGTARRRARELARRIGVDQDHVDDLGEADYHASGRVLSLAYPDRLAVRRRQPGRFQLRSGTGVWVPKGDQLGDESFLVVADLDGDRREARIRVAAAIDADDVMEQFGERVDEHVTVVWDRERDEIVERVERRLGGMVLDDLVRTPPAGDEVTGLLLQRVRSSGLERALSWDERSTSLRTRVAFLHRVAGAPWPDWSDAALLATLDEWLAPFLLFATGRRDLEALDLAEVLRARLDHALLRRLDGEAPTHFVVPSGRRVGLDYPNDGTAPVLAVAVQEMFGTAATPVVGGGVPVQLHLLSPAGRPLQITSDLASFWRGAWSEVRKEMAGRYPKHAWPADAASATPPRRDGVR